MERDDVVDTLSSLLDKSLLQVDYQPEETRFFYLDTVRAFAARKLEEFGDARDVREKHLAWCIDFAERMEPLLQGAEQRDASTAIGREIDNIRSALETALAPGGPAGSALRLAGAMFRYWFLFDTFAEGQAALRAALRAGGDDEPRLRAKASIALAYLLLQRREIEAAAELTFDVLEHMRTEADDRTIDLALNVAAVSSIFGKTGFDAAVFIEEMQARAEHFRDPWTAGLASYALSFAAMRDGDAARAAELLEQSLQVVRAFEDPYDNCAVSMQLGYSKLQLGDVSKAALLFIESSTWCEDLNNLILLGQCMEGLAFVASSLDAGETAALLFGAADALRAKSQAPRWAHWQISRERHWNAAREALGADLFERSWSRGYELALEDLYAPIRRFASELRASPVSTAAPIPCN